MSGVTRVLFILVLLSARTALALDPERHVTELVHRVWDSQSGAPADIRALAQTTDGYLWVGSLRGLYRFDGIQFQKFEPESGARLPSQLITSLLAASENRLWIGYRKGGVSVLQAGKLINYNSVDGFPEGLVRSLAQDNQGRIWAASTGGLACFEGGRWRTLGDESGFPGSGAQAILVDHLGALWVAGEQRIAVLSPHASRFELADEPYNGQVSQLAEAADGTVWMAETTRAVRPLKRPNEGNPYNGLTRDDCQNRFPGTWHSEPACRRPDDLEVRVGSVAILFDQNGSFWITSIGDGLRRAPRPSDLPRAPIGEFSNALEHFTSKNGLSSDLILAILEDRESNIWVATRDGIDQFRNGALAPVTFGPAAAQLSIAPENDGYVVAVDAESHIFRFHDAHNKIDLDNKRNPNAELLYRDPLGSIWSTGADGGCRLVGNGCGTRLSAPGEKHSWDLPWRLAVDGNHRLWGYVPTEGLFAFDDGKWKSIPSAPRSAVPKTQHTDVAGRVWFGFQDGRLLTIRDGQPQLYSSQDGLSLGEVKAIDSVGTHLWVGGERGLALLRGPRFTPVFPYDQPTFGSVSGIVEGDDGSLWLNEYRGIIRIPASEVSALLEDSSHATHYDLLTSPDGLPGATEQFASTPTAIRGTDGRLWFATINGAAWVDPRRLYRNTLPPPVFIQSIVADGRRLSPSGKLELPARTDNLQIAYTGLSLSVPERVQFRYRLKGLDDAWQSAGTRRAAYYTRLPPGAYEFQVMASNDAGVWNQAAAVLPIRVIPAWYQTWWFYVLSALLIGAALLAILRLLYQMRVGQLTRVFNRTLEARVGERTRIARELHDTLLQNFQGVLLPLRTAQTLIAKRPSQAEETLESAITQARAAITEGRSAVQGLRVSALEDHDFHEAIRTLGQELASDPAYSSSTALMLNIEGAPRALQPAVRDELFRIAGEALRNAYRYAVASRIEVQLNYGERRFELRIRDNGKGIDAKFLGDKPVPGHFGLRGLQERAKEVGAKFTLWSAPGSGTELEVSVPGSMAYATAPRAPFSWLSRRLSQGGYRE